MLRRWGCTTVERRGLGQSGLPDLTVSLNGRHLPLTISVKSVAGASLAHLVNHKGLAWTFWREVAAYPHPWLLLKLPRPWGWWAIFSGADLSRLEDWVGSNPNVWGLKPHGRAMLFADHDAIVLAQPFKDVLSWASPEQVQQAFK